MKLLFVEDNERLAEIIKSHLGGLYLLDIVHTGQQGIERASGKSYSVIVLDLKLPDMTGYDVCRTLRDAGVETPILILTADDDMESRVKLLTKGADDYLTKPFNINELKARITALSRRQAKPYTHSTLKLHDLIIDTNERKVSRAGVDIPLRRKEFDILTYMVNNRGRVLTREMILGHAWDAHKDTWNSTVDVHIKHLRDKIDRPFKTALIKTAYGVGYVIDAPEQ
jgi:DNA-binding response OmpR family regulator